MLKQYFFGNSPTSELVDDLLEFEVDFMEHLSRKQIPGLTTYKSILEQFKTDTLKLFEDYESNRINSPNVNSQINGIMKVKDQFYSIEDIWERNVSILELQLFKTQSLPRLKSDTDEVKLYVFVDNPGGL